MDAVPCASPLRNIDAYVVPIHDIILQHHHNSNKSPQRPLFQEVSNTNYVLHPCMFSYRLGLLLKLPS
ncbi:unnamed protein product [Lathyrus sativus]|nr:unnamed protein product [Lathyrus sativus]